MLGVESRSVKTMERSQEREEFRAFRRSCEGNEERMRVEGTVKQLA